MKTLAGSICTAFLAWTVASTAHATVIYTDEASFLDHTRPGYYLETFDSFPKNTIISSPLFASSNGFSYFISANAGFSNVGPGGDVWLSAAVPFTPIVFNPVSNVTAIGGYFFITDLNGGITPGKVTVRLDDGSTFSVIDPNAASFVGFITSSPIFSLTVTPASPAGSASYTTVNDFIAGATVPEAGSSALLLGLGIAGIALRRGFARWQGV